MCTVLLVGAARDAQAARTDLESLRDRLTATELLSGEGAAELAAVEGRLDDVASQVGSPVLAPAKLLPFLGRQLRSFEALAVAGREAVDAAGALATVVSDVAARDLEPGERPEAIAEVRAVVDATTAQLRAIELGPGEDIVTPLAEGRETLAEEIADAVATGDRASVVAAGAEQLLAGGRYVVLAANNAEMQAGWGMPLSVGLLEITDGALSLAGMESTGAVPLPAGAVPVVGELGRHWAFAQPTVDWRNLALTPYFEEAAPLAAQMWEARGGGAADGVIALDPFALAAILDATGPVEVEGRTVTSDDVVRTTLHDAYVEQAMDEDAGLADRRERQSAIAVAAIAAVREGDTDLVDLLTNLADAAEGRHVMLWSSRPIEQAAWQAAGIDGTLGDRSVLVSLVNRGGNKLDWFLDVDAAMSTSTPAQGGGREVAIEVTASNRTPDGEPQYIAGPYGGPTPLPLDAGDWGGYLTAHVPAGASDLTVEGVESLVATGASLRTQLISAPVVVKKGESRSLTVRFTVPDGVDELVVEASARARPIRWSLHGTGWTDEVARTVAIGGGA